jgi:hypothetical protein
MFAPANNLMNWYSTDDAFYYFKTAQNISEGYGITFDRIGTASGFHPLWMVVCVPVFALARFDLMLPLRVLVLLVGILNAGTGIFLYRLARRSLSEHAAIITAFLWLLSPSIQGVTSRLGMESAISAFFIVVLFYLVAGYEVRAGESLKGIMSRALPIGLVAALTILSRLDNIFLVGMAGIWLVFKRSGIRGWLIADMAIFYLSPIAASFWRLEPGAEYYQYAPSVYAVLAVSLISKPIIFEILGVYRNWKFSPALVVKLATGSIAAAGLAYLLLTLMVAAQIIPGFPRSLPLFDLLITLAAVVLVRLAGRIFSTNTNVNEDSLRSVKSWLPEGIGFGLPIAFLLGAYFVFNFFYFGTPAPVSGQIKHWWGSLPNTVYGWPNEVWEGFIGFPENEHGPWNPVQSIVNTRFENAAENAGVTVYEEPYYSQMNLIWTGILILAGTLVFLNRKKIRGDLVNLALPALFLGCMCQIASYMGTSYVNTRPWYWVQEMVLIVLAAGVLFDAFLSTLARFRITRNIHQTVVVFFSLFMLYNFVADLVYFVPYYVKPGNERLYLAGVDALEEATPAGAIIGSTGGGVVAYFIQDRTIINLDGLMNTKEYFHLLKEGRATEYMDFIGMQFLHGNKYMITNSDPYMGMFKNRLEFVKDVWGSGLYLYKSGG